MAMGGSAPAGGNGMSTMNTGMNVPVFLIWGGMSTRWVGATVRADGRSAGGAVHARGDDGWRWVGPPLRMAMECQRENTGMDVPVFLI